MLVVGHVVCFHVCHTRTVSLKHSPGEPLRLTCSSIHKTPSGLHGVSPRDRACGVTLLDHRRAPSRRSLCPRGLLVAVLHLLCCSAYFSEPDRWLSPTPLAFLSLWLSPVSSHVAVFIPRYRSHQLANSKPPFVSALISHHRPTPLWSDSRSNPPRVASTELKYTTDQTVAPRKRHSSQQSPLAATLQTRRTLAHELSSRQNTNQ